MLLPAIEGLFRNPVLSDDLNDRRSRFRLAKCIGYLFLRKPFFLRGNALSNPSKITKTSPYGWAIFWGAGHDALNLTVRHSD
jgi:hypothetical protein